MSLPSRLIACLLLAIAAAPSAGGAEDAAKLIEQLGSDEFSGAQTATRKLQGLGRTAIPHLVEAIGRDDVETRHRAVVVLSHLASSDDPADGDAVFSALADVDGASDSSSSAKLVRQALKEIRAQSEFAAIETLKRAGAEVSVRAAEGGQGTMVQMRSGWQGQDRQLGLLLRINELTSVSIEDSRIGDAALDPIARLKQLRWLYLGSSRVTGKGLPRLGSLDELEHLSLRNLPLDDAAFAQLPAMPQLQALGLDGTRISDAGLKHLGDFPALRTLWLERTAITAAGLAEVANLEQLSALYLAETKVSGEGLSALKQLPALKFLSLKGCQLSPGDVQRLRGLGLETLGLDHTNVADEHLAQLNGVSNLRTLWLSKTAVTDESVEKLLEFKRLETLYLHGSGISEHGAAKLRQQLPACRLYR